MESSDEVNDNKDDCSHQSDEVNNDEVNDAEVNNDQVNNNEVNNDEVNNDEVNNDEINNDSKSVARILVIGDLHFSQRSFSLLAKLETKLLEAIKKYKPDHVVFLGDTLDRFGSINSAREREAITLFYKSSLLVPCTLLIGNHDIPNKTYFMSHDHGFTGLKYYWKNMTVVDTQCIEFEINGMKFQAVPYCPNGRLLEGLNTNPNRSSNPAAIFCHQEIYGCDLDPIISTEGDNWEESNTLLVCGHIHKHHQPQSNVLYIGSPYQDNFGEDPDKSISLLTFTKNSNLIDWKEKRIRLNLPQKRSLIMTAKEFKTWEPIKNTIYKLEIHGSISRNANLRGSDKVTDIINKGGIVTFVNTDKISLTLQDGEITEQLSLKQTVAESIKEKPHLHAIYAKIFSS
jgi:predicted MPP superfamily phosphohydrolase